MTKRYPGGYITKTPPTVSTTSAPGIWTMEQQAAYQKAGTWPFGGPFNYIEDVFSTWLYTGAGGAQTVSTGIDLATYGGLLWNKNRTNAISNVLTDTVRGANAQLVSNTTAAQGNYGVGLSFLTNGFSLSSVDSAFNTNGANYASWTFRKQPKFFDVVTYTGNGVAGRQIAHSLGAVPGCMIIKNTSSAGYNWAVYHRSLTSNQYALQLQATAAQLFKTAYWNSTTPTSTVFTVGDDADVNENGQVYVAYLFAHNAGGFGLTGTDNVISCGSFTTDSTGNGSVTLGYEPQWLMMKNTTGTGNWVMFDNMRGLGVAGTSYTLSANTSNAEVGPNSVAAVNATGFSATITGSSTYIYIAIRRGPMKTPTDATKVFQPTTYTGTGVDNRLVNTGIVTDFAMFRQRNSTNPLGMVSGSRLTGQDILQTGATDAATSVSNALTSWASNVGVIVGSYSIWELNTTSAADICEAFGRAPGFMDSVCYTGDGTFTQQVSHNLGVAPTLIFVKSRSAVSSWPTYVNTGASQLTQFAVNSTSGSGGTSSGGMTSTYFTPGNILDASASSPVSSGTTYVAYLFASCAGVSKVGSYTGTGATQTIDCGFPSGVRFVLIKRTDSTGNWYIWDTARGMTSGNDRYLQLNTTNAEVNTNWVYTVASGFQIVTSNADVNASGGSYIYLAIA